MPLLQAKAARCCAVRRPERHQARRPAIIRVRPTGRIRRNEINAAHARRWRNGPCPMSPYVPTVCAYISTHSPHPPPSRARTHDTSSGGCCSHMPPQGLGVGTWALAPPLPIPRHTRSHQRPRGRGSKPQQPHGHTRPAPQLVALQVAACTLAARYLTSHVPEQQRCQTLQAVASTLHLARPLHHDPAPRSHPFSGVTQQAPSGTLQHTGPPVHCAHTQRTPQPAQARAHRYADRLAGLRKGPWAFTRRSCAAQEPGCSTWDIQARGKRGVKQIAREHCRGVIGGGDQSVGMCTCSGQRPIGEQGPARAPAHCVRAPKAG